MAKATEGKSAGPAATGPGAKDSTGAQNLMTTYSNMGRTSTAVSRADLGHGFSVEFISSDGMVQCRWSPDIPTPDQLGRIKAAYIAALMNHVAAHPHGKTALVLA